MWKKGDLARLCGLVAKSQHNGKIGLVLEVGAQRLTVRCIPDDLVLAVCPINALPFTDASVTVCSKCKGDYWSWATHNHYAGWTKTGRSFSCPACSQRSAPYATAFASGSAIA